MRLSTFNAIRKLVYDKCGIYLSENKMPLVTARLQKRLRLLDLKDYEEYLVFLNGNNCGNEIVEFLNVISTNTTYFFREAAHFPYYVEIVNNLIHRGSRRIRVWCAASSTGEEPYTLAMCYADKCMYTADTDFRILATDISTKVLETADAGIYKKDKLQEVPGDMRYKYFNKVHRSHDDFSVDNSLRSLITFRRLNLIETPFPMQGPLDVIFCRNVMIYFDLPVKQRLIEEIYRLLSPGGYLFTGHSESISGIQNHFQMIKPAVYKKIK